MDDKMGDIGDSELREKLDDKMWGDDDKDDEEEKDENKEVSYDQNEISRHGSRLVRVVLHRLELGGS